MPKMSSPSIQEARFAQRSVEVDLSEVFPYCAACDREVTVARGARSTGFLRVQGGLPTRHVPSYRRRTYLLRALTEGRLYALCRSCAATHRNPYVPGASP